MEIRKIQIEDIRESEFNPRVRLEKDRRSMSR